MARISLRAYNRDIEVMIDRNQIEEAIAHSRYILEFYPKHVDTYRLMGKALLEAQRFGDAVDVFHRVLSSVPDDFIAHLGMSIVREDEKNLDGAIWHMERSFEVQPSNAAVQVELRRLYGLRDGVSPQKIQLTRGALARMSAKSNLFSQAIAELRAALSDDPQRPDLQVVLANMYAQSGSRMEAIETCNSLISKLPYCLVANRLLSEILPDTERAERAQEFKDRLVELDPYYGHLSPVAQTVDQVSEGAVTIERHDYSGESLAEPSSGQPGWAASLGVDLDEEPFPGEETPDWLLPDSDESASELEDEILEDILNDQEVEEAASIFPEVAASDQLEETPEWLVTEEDDTSVHEDEQLPESILPEENESEQPDVEETSERDMDSQDDAFEQADDEPLEDQSSERSQDDELPVELPEAEPLPDWMSETEQSVPTETPDWLRNAMEGEEQDTPLGAGLAAAAGAAAVLSGDEHEDMDSIADEEGVEAEFPPDVVEHEGKPETEIEELSESGPGEDEAGITPDEGLVPEAAAGSEFAAGTAIIGAAVASSMEHEEEDDDADAGSEAPADEFKIESVPSEESDQIPEPLLDQDEEIGSTDEPEIPDWLQDLGEDLPEDAAEEPDLDHDADAEIAPEEVGSEFEQDVDLEFISEGDMSEDDEAVVPVDEPGEVEFDTSPIPVAIMGEELSEEEFPESLPDWLTAVSPDEVPDVADQEVSGPDGQIDIVQAEIPDWLRRMEQEHLAEMAAAVEAGDFADALDYDADFTDLTGDDVPPWLVSAMGTVISQEKDDQIEDLEEMIPVADLVGEESGVQEIMIEDLTDEAQEIEFVGEEDIAPEEMEQAAVSEDQTVAATDLEPSEFEVTDKELVGDEITAESTPGDEPVTEEIEIEEFEQPSGEELLTEEQGPFVVLEEGEVPEEITAEEPEREALVVGLDIDEEITPELMDELVTDEPMIEGDTQPVFIGEVIEPVEAEQGFEATEEILPEFDETEGEISSIEEDQPVTAEMEAFPAETPLTGEDEDAAMAWLESLAAKQGAAEEELLTEPGERIEQPPEWVLESAAEGEGEPKSEQEHKIDEIAAAAAAGAVAAALVGDEEDQEVPVDGEAAIFDDTSEWIPEPTITHEEVAPFAEIDSDAIVDDEKILAPAADEILPVDATVDEVEAVVPTGDFEEQEISEEIAEPETAVEEPVMEDQPVEEIPDWLSGIDEEEDAIEAQPAEFAPGMVDETEPEIEELVEAEIETKIDLNAASLAQLERIPGIGFIHAQRIVDWRTNSGPFQELDQLETVPGLTPDMVEDLKAYLTVEVVVEAAPPISTIPELQEAWKSITEGEIDAAVNQYLQLIKQDQHLDEVIRDLQEALVKFPADSSLYQSLGDAYMHANMLQEALDAYNRAEDLIK